MLAQRPFGALRGQPRLAVQGPAKAFVGNPNGSGLDLSLGLPRTDFNLDPIDVGVSVLM